jgi:HAD superfamily hydrolase (TIGR01549 family)
LKKQNLDTLRPTLLDFCELRSSASYNVTNKMAASATGRTLTRLRAVVFDMDGTLTAPHTIDFARMRSRLACPPQQDLLHFVASAPCPETRASREAIIVDEELRAEIRLQPDVGVVATWLRTRNLGSALLTRNNAQVTRKTLELLGPGFAFGAVLSREWPGPPKPDPAPLLHIARELGCEPHEVCMVGDSVDDVECGRNAGALSVLIGDTDCARAAQAAHYRVPTLSALVGLLDSLIAQSCAVEG